MHIRLFADSIALLAVTSLPLCATQIDSIFFTTYWLNAQNTTLSWQVASGYGINDSGTLGLFGRVASMMEGNASQNLKKGTVSRDIYVVDAEYGTDKNEIALYIYQKVDTPEPNGTLDSTTITLLHTIVLPLTGGKSSVVSMAGNAKYIYIGTNQDEAAVQIAKSNPFYQPFVGGISGTTITSITSDQYGYVTISAGTSGIESGVAVYSPNGQEQEAGAQVGFMLNTVQGVPITVP
jgi:hypothetical protein